MEKNEIYPLIDNIPDSYVYQYTQNAEGKTRFLFISAGVEKLHGIRAVDAMKDADLLRARIDPEQMPALLKKEAISIKKMIDFQIDLRMRDPSNQWRWIKVCCHPHRESENDVLWDGVATDITSHKQAELTSQAAEQRLADIIEFLPDATIVVDSEKRVVAWNRACEVITGVKKEDVLGKGDYAYSKPFFGKRRPILLDMLDQPSYELENAYKYIVRKGDIILGESFIPRLHEGRGGHFWAAATPLFDPQGHRCGTIEVIRDMTEQKEIEQALRESELKHRMLFETTSEAILLMRDYHFVDCNLRALKLFGCSRDQIIGTSLHDFSPSIQPDGSSSEEKIKEKINLVMDDGPQIFEWINCRRDGTSFISEVSLNRIDLEGDTMLQINVRDITDRKRAEERLTASEQKYRELVELANSIILRWDSNGIVTFMNEFGLKFFGYSSEEILGRSVTETIVPSTESGGRDLHHLMAEITANPIAFEQNINENVRSNGERVWIAWNNKVVLNDKGEMVEILSIGTDITERKRAEDEIHQLHEELRNHAAELERRVKERTAELAVARDRAEESDRLKSAFLATMSHELRTPLNSIIGFTGIILQGLAGPLNEEQRKQLEMVKSSARHLLALINEVLDISKIEAGQLEVSLEPFNLHESIEKVASIVKPFAEKKGLAMIVEITPEINTFISDQQRVEQILINLLNNAIKFTEYGEIKLHAEIELDKLRISVIDSGIGIKTEDMPKLFQPFRQINTGLARNHEGTGLGLAICRRLANLLGGEIEIESVWGKGSTFTVVLPIKGKSKT